MVAELVAGEIQRGGIERLGRAEMLDLRARLQRVVVDIVLDECGIIAAANLLDDEVAAFPIS